MTVYQYKCHTRPIGPVLYVPTIITYLPTYTLIMENITIFNIVRLKDIESQRLETE